MILFFEEYIQNKRGHSYEVEYFQTKSSYGVHQIYFLVTPKGKSTNILGRLWLFNFLYENKFGSFFPIGLGKTSTNKQRSGIYTNLLIYAAKFVKKHAPTKDVGICSFANTHAADDRYSEENRRTKEADLFWSNLYIRQNEYDIVIQRKYNTRYEGFDYFMKIK